MAKAIERPEADAQAAFPSSRKVYVQGSRPDIRVAMREVQLTPTRTRGGAEENPPLRVYDTSGPYTDPDCCADIDRGLPYCAGPGCWSEAT